MILGQYGLNPDAGIPKLGVNHADELYLMWDPVYNNHHILDSNDQSMVSIIYFFDSRSLSRNETVSSFSKCHNGTIPCSNCSVKTLVH